MIIVTSSLIERAQDVDEEIDSFLKVAAFYEASRACRSCSKEAADHGVAVDVPHTLAALCFRLGAGSASRNAELTVV